MTRCSSSATAAHPSRRVAMSGPGVKAIVSRL
eukprot:CAMPEP_0206846880 /NCGR_PEP_ID=MMETSP0975-20121206/25216_1 /ASSEMBLY_ACC=CAM_ASM_000399 /TAXON_ID=483370 /ORGANISM="non described non described, Strain CCMP2097" /LENGTH=31 /DNA_ID= /DNA_START= /DNA_END= /DNA_ORIENTATION=